jgi:tRNA modification GTPase
MINQYMTDTISAIATPIGNGGVSIIRLSGPDAFNIIDKMFSSQNLTAGKIYHGWIIENGEKLIQFIHTPVLLSNLESVEEDEFTKLHDKSLRGEGGFGSTGTK